VEAAKEYSGSLGFIVRFCEGEEPGQHVDLILRLLGEAHSDGDRLRSQLARAELYGTRQEQFAAQRLSLAILQANVITSGHYSRELPKPEDLNVLRSTMAAINEHQPSFVARARGLSEDRQIKAL
jgi:hypothetical protein